MTTPAIKTIRAVKESILALDMALTGKPRDSCEQAWVTRFHEWKDYKPSKTEAPNFTERLTRDVYYLSDGGYSRVGISEDGYLFLASVSREVVKQLWNNPEVMRLRSDAERIIRSLLQEEGLL